MQGTHTAATSTVVAQKPGKGTLLSDSVGSIMSVPATGQDMVGAWKP